MLESPPCMPHSHLVRTHRRRMVVQITMSSYTGSLAAALSKSATIYHGPLTQAELSRTTVCLPMFSQSEIDEFQKRPTSLSRGGQFWGQRLLASTRRGFVGGFVAPEERWDAPASMGDRMDLCAKRLRTAPDGQLMAIMMPKSVAREFLKNNCADFALAPDLRFTSLESGPNFILAAGLITQVDRKYLQTWNAVSKFLSATLEYRALEKKYLGTDTTCPTSDGDAKVMTLYQQSGVPTVPHSRRVGSHGLGFSPFAARLLLAGRAFHHRHRFHGRCVDCACGPENREETIEGHAQTPCDSLGCDALSYLRGCVSFRSQWKLPLQTCRRG